MVQLILLSVMAKSSGLIEKEMSLREVVLSVKRLEPLLWQGFEAGPPTTRDF